jgi:hypothetical protein
LPKPRFTARVIDQIDTTTRYGLGNSTRQRPRAQIRARNRAILNRISLFFAKNIACGRRRGPAAKSENMI